MASKETVNRSIMVAILAILVVILILAARINTGEGESQNPALDNGIVRLGDVPVAEVNKTPIYMSDVRNVARANGKIQGGETLERDDQLFKDVLDELIDQRLMALEAFTLSLDQNADAKRRLAQARERVLGNVLVEEHLKTAVTDETARQMFDAQSSLRNRGQQVRARHILLPDEVSANQISERLDAGESFQSLALAYSIDRASREAEGDLGYFTRDMLGSILTEIAFGAEIGSRVGPFQSKSGWHILEVLDRRQAPEPKFEEVKDEIVKLMTYEEIKTLLEGLHAKAEIVRFPVPQKTPEKNTETTP